MIVVYGHILSYSRFIFYLCHWKWCTYYERFRGSHASYNLPNFSFWRACSNWYDTPSMFSDYIVCLGQLFHCSNCFLFPWRLISTLISLPFSQKMCDWFAREFIMFLSASNRYCAQCEFCFSLSASYSKLESEVERSVWLKYHLMRKSEWKFASWSHMHRLRL